jgi:predicted N-acetyltransferase YhbS
MPVSRIFETMMLLCWGAAWPSSIAKMLRTKQAAGKSRLFLVIILMGYVAGMGFKLTGAFDGVFYLYLLNFVMVSIDLALVLKYRRKELRMMTARPDDAAVREAVLAITRTAFLINPETGKRIEGDTPNELPMVEALFARGAVDHLHVAAMGERIVGYILYSRGSLGGAPDVHVQGLMIMGVEPGLQRRGIGTRLLAWSVERMRGRCDALFVLGHPRFYPRAGFVTAKSLGLSFSIPAPEEACMAMSVSDRPLPPGVLSYHPIVRELF